MARTNTLTTTVKFIPALLLALAAAMMLWGVASFMGQITGIEYDCKVTKFEKVAGNPNELLIHTDGCSGDGNKEGKVFKANTKDLAANFTEQNFYDGVNKGETFTMMVKGLAVKELNMIPTITKVSENMLPY